MVQEKGSMVVGHGHGVCQLCREHPPVAVLWDPTNRNFQLARILAGTLTEHWRIGACSIPKQ